MPPPPSLHLNEIILHPMHGISHWNFLGAVHEQSRPDRDFHVSILIENVEPGSRKNFRKESGDSHSGRGTPFDHLSIMIYGPKDFGIEDSMGQRKTTIQPLDPKVEIR